MRAARSARIIAWALARSDGSESRADFTGPSESHPPPIVKTKPLSHRRRAPGFLRVSPVDPGEQISELGSRDRHRAVGRRWPQKASPLQSFGEQARPLAVVPDNLQKITPAAAEAEHMAAQGIALEHLLDLQSQRWKALPHVGVTSGQPHPNASRDRNHPWRARTRRTRARALSS